MSAGGDGADDPIVPEGADQELRLRQWTENVPLQHLCRYNRITKAKFVQSADLYEQVEVFQEMIFELPSVAFFPNLVELWVMDQAPTVHDLKGLESCTNLRVINVTQVRWLVGWLMGGYAVAWRGPSDRGVVTIDRTLCAAVCNTPPHHPFIHAHHHMHAPIHSAV